MVLGILLACPGSTTASQQACSVMVLIWTASASLMLLIDPSVRLSMSASVRYQQANVCHLQDVGFVLAGGRVHLKHPLAKS